MTTPTDSLIHISDLHFWEVVFNPLMLLNKRFLGNANVIYRRRHEFHMAQATPYGEHIASLGIDNLVIGGDFTSTATPNEYQRGKDFVDAMASKGLNIHLMPGNHDVYTFESVRKRRFEQFFGDYAPDAGYPNRSTLPGGTPLILVPTVCPNLLSSAGNITDEEAVATQALIEACPGGPIVVAGHYPILHQTHSYNSGNSRQLRNAKKLRAALGETGRQILYIAGHVHRFSYTQDDQYPALQHLTTGAFFLQRPGQAQRGAFSVIHVDSDGFQVDWHTYTDDWKQQRAEPKAPPASWR